MGTVLWLAHRRRNQDETCSVRSHLLSASRVKFSASKKTKPEQREHEVLHRQQRDRLSSLGSGSWGGNSVFCQPGVEPLQRRQPRWHQGRKPGNKHKVFPREQQSSWQRPPWVPRWVRSGCGHPLCSWEPLWLNRIIVFDINFFFSVFLKLFLLQSLISKKKLETNLALNRIFEFTVPSFFNKGSEIKKKKKKKKKKK